MKPNVGNIDRIIRVVAGALLIVAWIAGWMSGAFAVVLGIVGLVLALTGLMSVCPLYSLLKIDTRNKKHLA